MWYNTVVSKSVLLFQIDGKLPNFALMRLSTWHKSKGDDVTLCNTFADCPPHPDMVYASSIFTTSHQRREKLHQMYPNAIVGGDGYYPVWSDLSIKGRDVGSNLREIIKDIDPQTLQPDYSLYPEFTASLGYSQRGCRLDCWFCRMKTREGEARRVSTLRQMWRGEPYPKHIFLLDNDFFGQKEWEEFLVEAIEGKFKICFNQGINVRLITSPQAQLLSKCFYSDDAFSRRRLYTAWDSLKDEKIFKSQILLLRDAGIPSHKIMVYMLIGAGSSGIDTRPFSEQEPEILYRYNELVKLGCKPYPMVFSDPQHPPLRPLKIFQRWVIRRYNTVCKWEEFEPIVRYKRDNSGVV